MGNYMAKPQLGFGDAFKLASSRLTDFSGRSRRSEFWWFILIILVANMITGMIFSTLPVVNAIASTIVWGLALSVTARRLQDSGKSALWVYVSYGVTVVYNLYVALSGFSDKIIAASQNPTQMMKVISDPILVSLSIVMTIVSICVIIFCILDGNSETNKYGESPKYVENAE